MTVRKVFIVGPHLPDRYRLLSDYVKTFAEREAPETTVEVVTPIDNPLADRFNDWIFGQIDTCDLLIADMTGFNPNVVYEVAFAHTLGTPCIYLQFADGTTSDEEVRDISHYFKFSLISSNDEDELLAEVEAELLSNGTSAYLDGHLARFFAGQPTSGETILSDYYGAFPADAEFMRGLAEGYYRNFLSFVLEAKPPPEDEGLELKIIIPDTFETTDGEIDRVKSSRLPSKYVLFPDAFNSLNRQLGTDRYKGEKEAFFFDIPTTVLTVTESSKYKKISDGSYFSIAERDALTDRLARKFVASIWIMIKRNRRSIKFPTSKLKFVWLSEVVDAWHPNETLMNSVPFERPDGF